MINSLNNKLKIVFFTALLSFIFLKVEAQQVNTLSSFSGIGIGNLNYNNQTSFNSMGGASIAVVKPFQLNMSNPATYSFLFTPVFDIGGRSENLKAESEQGSQTKSDAFFTNLGLGFKVGNRGGLSFGLQPISSVGYNVSLETQDPIVGELITQAEGDGGVNDLYLGYSYLVTKNDSLKISLGANANYLFGHVDQQTKFYYPQGFGYVNTISSESIIFNDFGLNFGLIIQKKLKHNIDATLGATYSFGKDINVGYDRFIGAFISDGNDIVNVVDTVSLVEGEKRKFSKPQQVRGGLSFMFNDKLLLSFDASYGVWKNKSSQEYVFFDNDSKFKNDVGLRFGVEYTPDGKMKFKGNFFKAISYRAGVNYTNCYQTVNDKQISEISTTFGLGIPLYRKASATRINLGMQYGQRGDINSTLIKEEFINYYIGFTIVPTWKDKWFVKRKYN